MNIVISDFDGTLARHSMVLKENREAVERFRKAGHLFMICSGRGYITFDDYLRMEIDGYLMATGADLVIEGKRYTRHLSKETASKIVRAVRGSGYIMFLENTTTTKLFHQGTLVSFLVNLCRFHHRNDVFDLDDCISLSLTYPTAKMRDHALSKIMKAAGDEVDCMINGKSIDIIPKGVSKASACMKVKELYPDAEIYVIGDNFNDLPMIEAFNGACMKSGEEEVKKKAHWVYESVAKYIDDILNGVI